MKILFITVYDPLNVRCGGSVRNRFIWEALNKCGEVYTTVLKDSVKPHVDSERRICYVSPFESMRRTRAETFVRAISGVGIDGCFAERRDILASLGWPESSFDCVVVRFLRLVTGCAAWKVAPVIADIDDLPSEDFDTMERPNMPWIKGVFKSWCVRRWQNFRLKKCCSAWLPNPLQLDFVRRYCPCELLPNIARKVAEDYDKGVSRKRQLMTVASFAYEPNVQGVAWFLKDVWPTVYERYPDLSYAIAGYGLEVSLASEWEKIPGVKVLGFVNDLDRLYAESLAAVVPVFSGGGTAVKVIEAMSYGKKVFATPFGLRGLSDWQKRKAALDEFHDAEEFLSQFDHAMLSIDSVGGGMRQVYRECFSQEFFESQVSKVIIR